MSELSLTETMACVAQNLNDSEALVGGVCAIEALEEAYEALDPLLAALKKQLLDARHQVARLRQAYGVDSPMGDVAEDMMESAESAYQTRLLEVKARGDLAQKASAMVAETVQQDHESLRESLSRAYRVKMKAFYDRLRAREKVKHARKEAEDGLFTALLLVTMLQWTINETQRQLKLVSVFMRASVQELDDRAVRAV